MNRTAISPIAWEKLPVIRSANSPCTVQATNFRKISISPYRFAQVSQHARGVIQILVAFRRARNPLWLMLILIPLRIPVITGQPAISPPKAVKAPCPIVLRRVFTTILKIFSLHLWPPPPHEQFRTISQRPCKANNIAPKIATRKRGKAGPFWRKLRGRKKRCANFSQIPQQTQKLVQIPVIRAWVPFDRRTYISERITSGLSCSRVSWNRYLVSLSAGATNGYKRQRTRLFFEKRGRSHNGNNSRAETRKHRGCDDGAMRLWF